MFGEMNLKEAIKLHNVSKGGYKSEEEESALENIELLYESQKTFIKLFNDYSSIVSNCKFKAIFGKGIPSMSTRVACVGKVSDHSNLKILSPKQMLQRLIIALAQVKEVIHPKTYLMKSDISIFFVSSTRNYYKIIQQCNEFNKNIKQNRYYIYEF